MDLILQLRVVLCVLCCAAVCLITVASEPCTDGDIRNSYGHQSDRGLLQVCKDGVWNDVCYQSMDCETSRVACRQLGYTRLTGYFYFPDQDRSVANFIRTKYDCKGDEAALSQCGTQGTLGSCGTLGSTVLYCKNLSKYECEDNDVRLVGGPSDREGKVEFCYGGTWSTMCRIKLNEGGAICRQLGFSKFATTSVYDQRYYSPARSSYIPNTNCPSNATNLSQCTKYTIPLCNPSQNVKLKVCNRAIRCHRFSGCEEGAVRLVDGAIEQEGRVEVCIDGVWGSVCGGGTIKWTRIEASVVCKQLGYSVKGSVGYSVYSYGPIVYGEAICGGWEQKFIQCQKKEYGLFHCSGTAVGVRCKDDCSDGDVRVVGGASPTEGTVLVCYNNLWGMITEDGWGDNDATVVCRQLGYSSEGATAYVGSHFGKPNMTIQASNFTCEGHEEVLSECNHASFPLEMGKTLIRQVEVAGVSCQCPLGGDSCATVSFTPIQTSSVAANQTFVGTPLYILIGVVCITISVTIIIFLAILIYYKQAHKKQTAAFSAVKSTKLELKTEEEDDSSVSSDQSNKLN